MKTPFDIRPNKEDLEIQTISKMKQNELYTNKDNQLSISK